MNKSPWRTALLAGLLISGLLACARAPAAPDPDRAALEAATRRWVAAVNARDVAALNATMTEDVELLDAGKTVTGRETVIRVLREGTSPGKLVATTREIKVANDFAWQVVGLAEARNDGVVRASGQALEIWKRVNGEWRLHRRMTGGATPDALLTRPSTREPVLDKPKD